MKTILILTDFSKRAEYAAEYALNIALKSRANLLLCHVIELASEVIESVELDWPIPEHLVQKKDETIQKLDDLKNRLEKLAGQNVTDFKPVIEYTAYFGLLPEVTENVIFERSADLVVIGLHRLNGLVRFLFGNRIHHLLDKIGCPVLLIPEDLKYRGISSIAYATDLSFDNTQVISYLVKMAKDFNSSISVNHISLPEFPGNGSEQSMIFSLKKHLASYTPPVFYHGIKGYNIKASLLEIIGSGRADILALVHKKYAFFERLFHTSISKQMADSTTIPLLVLPYSFSKGEGCSTANKNYLNYESGESR